MNVLTITCVPVVLLCRDRSPGACNGCSKYNHCRYDKFRYSADLAHKEYRKELVDARIGINMTYEELKALANVVVLLIKAGQSPYQVITNHPELTFQKKLSITTLKMVALENLDLLVLI